MLRLRVRHQIQSFFVVIDFDVSLQRFHLQRQVAVIHTVRKVPLLLLFFF